MATISHWLGPTPVCNLSAEELPTPFMAFACSRYHGQHYIDDVDDDDNDCDNDDDDDNDNDDNDENDD